MKTLLLILPTIAFVIGCDPANDVTPTRKEWPQKCQMCGAEWLVTPLDPSVEVPSTVEWCFHDGSYCEVGLQLVLKQNHVLVAELQDVQREFLNHCLACEGCRFAAFEPDEWRMITEAIKNVRAR